MYKKTKYISSVLIFILLVSFLFVINVHATEFIYNENETHIISEELKESNGSVVDEHNNVYRICINEILHYIVKNEDHANRFMATNESGVYKSSNGEVIVVHKTREDYEMYINKDNSSDEYIKNGRLYYNRDGIIIEDNAKLLRRDEMETIIESMRAIREHGGVAFVTSDKVTSSTNRYAEEKYREFFGAESGVIFVIDMKNREIYIFSDGEMYKSITETRAYDITDNVYQYATNEEYGICAIKAFEQMKTVLDNEFLFVPMRLITGILLGMNIALIMGITIVCKQRQQKFTLTDISLNTEHFDTKNKVVLTNVYKTSNSSGSSSGGGGGGSGGGGSSGGGGGHGF